MKNVKYMFAISWDNFPIGFHLESFLRCVEKTIWWEKSDENTMNNTVEGSNQKSTLERQ